MAPPAHDYQIYPTRPCGSASPVAIVLPKFGLVQVREPFLQKHLNFSSVILLNPETEPAFNGTRHELILFWLERNTEEKMYSMYQTNNQESSSESSEPKPGSTSFAMCTFPGTIRSPGTHSSTIRAPQIPICLACYEVAYQ